jgi:hypothetical protein
MKICCYTSFTYAYLSRARVLVEGIRHHHPEWDVYGVIVDEARTEADEQALQVLFDGVIRVGDLEIPRVKSWLFKHNIVEACTAVKAHAMIKLLRNYDAVIYLDPDIAIFNPLSDVVALLKHHAIILTPHQIAENDRAIAIADNEGTSMRYGIFNLGFIAVRADPEGVRFADWWSRQLYRACYDDVANGIFTDQKYCDLVPGLFNSVSILRDPGYNVASWNLSTRRLAIHNNGEITVNGLPLRFFHFTKIGGPGDFMIERYAGDNLAVMEMVEWYRREIFGDRRQIPPNIPWQYGKFSDGTPISFEIRLFYRGRKDLMRSFSDPYDASPGGLRDWLRIEQPALVMTD